MSHIWLQPTKPISKAINAMDERTEERMYSGNPLVTFAVLAFEQEDYIRQAIHGAFTQRYEPIEIILSDDCSTDSTYVIMQQLAAEYDGPHRIICRKNSTNLGTFNHLLSVSREAQGRLLIVNAGDDISYANRTEELVKAWKNTGASALSSGYDEIDAHGTVKRTASVIPPSKAAQIVFGRSKIAQKWRGKVVSIAGFSAAYDNNLIKTLTYSPGKLLIEDGTISGVLNCLGLKISLLELPLIQYRIHGRSTTVRESKPNRELILNRERKISKTAESVRLMITQIFLEMELRNIQIENTVINALRTGLRYSEIAAGFWERPPIERIVQVIRCRGGDCIRFVLPRLFGQKIFVVARVALSIIRKNRKLA